jgi:hypothetical protein
MKALKYIVTVSIDPVHSWGDRDINEIYVPSIGCCFNQENFAFFSKGPRNNKTEEIKISNKDIKVLKNYCNLKKEVEKICKTFFSPAFDKIERK